MKELPTREVLHELLAYDPETGSLTWRPRKVDLRNWNYRCAGKTAGNVDAHGYRRISIGNSKFWAHRLIWRMMTGEQPDVIDHINGNRDDNRWCNLRAATNATNLWNRGASARNSTGYKGVYFSRVSGRYAAQIRAHGKVHYLGLHDTPEDAARAYATAAASLHGEFANDGVSRPMPAYQRT